MRNNRQRLNKYRYLLISAVFSLIFGIFLIIIAPDEATKLSSVYFSNAQNYESLAATEIYPVGVIGSETSSGREYVYYIVSAKDAGNADYLYVLKSANQDLARLLDATGPTAFEDSVFGKATALSDEVKSALDELVESEKLDAKYAIAQWCFEDNARNIDAEATLCIIFGFLLIISSFVIFYIFTCKISGSNA